MKRSRTLMRRTRYGLGSLVLALAVGASCVIAGVLGTRYHARWDVTATRQHTLAPRTLAILDATPAERTIVVSADMRRLDAQSARAISDLLAEFARRAPNLTVAWIDTGAPSGRADFAELIATLARADAQGIQQQHQMLTDTLAGVRELSASMIDVSDRLKSLGTAFGPSSSQAADLERQAGVVRTLPARIDTAAQAILAASEHQIGGALLPAVDAAADAARAPLTEIARAMQAIFQFAQSLETGSAAAPPEVTAAAGALADEAQMQMEQAARLVDNLDRLRPGDPLIVARTLEAGDAVLITSSAGTLAIDFASLFPSARSVGAADSGAIDRVFAGEQLIATALASLTETRTPVLVLLHAEDATLVDSRGGPTPVGRALFGRIFERMRLARIEPVEWRIAADPLRPDLRAIDPSGERPVVWLVMAPPSLVGAEAQGPGGLENRRSRFEKMAQAVASLLSDGQSVLLSLDPSDLPAVGEQDPFAQALVPYGIGADTGRPLLRRESAPAGQVTYTYLVARSADTDHPVAGAIAGLAVALPWTTPLTLADPAPGGVRLWPLLQAPVNRATWGESQWLLLRGLEARGRINPLTPPPLADPPTPDDGRDLTEAPADRWTLGAAAERTGGAAQRPQRLIVLSSPAWMHQLYAASSESIGGRRALRFPGNAELFEASVQWLAGSDELIGAGPQSRDVPRIEPLTPGALTLLRWVIIAAPPLLTLLVGALLRILRG